MKRDNHFLHEIDQSWTLFLDRDGVINHRIEGDYVRNKEQLRLMPKALEAFYDMKDIFLHTLVVTNQQGIGKGLMTHEDLAEVHSHLVEQVEAAQGTIDQIYYAPQLQYLDSNMRKPNVGMGLQAQKDFPHIDFDKSIIVGDSCSDMEFGLKLGMKTVYINNPNDLRICNNYHISCSSLYEFAQMVRRATQKS